MKRTTLFFSLSLESVVTERAVKSPSNLIPRAISVLHFCPCTVPETIDVTTPEDLTAHIAYRIAAAAAVSGPDGQSAELLPNCVLPSIARARGSASDLHAELTFIFRMHPFRLPLLANPPMTFAPVMFT